MDRINRSAIILRPQDPFVAWINSTGDGADPITLQDVYSDHQIYLVTPIETDEDLEAILDEQYLEIFEDQLYAWCTDENLWPQNRDRELFHIWFDFVVCTEVSDLG